MTVNFEIKGMLAKLLATEDILVEHRNVDTASFNVDTRTLVLPIWSNASENIYDILLCHEASHSIYTPNYDWTKTHKIPHAYLNICEDVRVEKLIKRRYAGLPKVFYKGYKELYEQDFFEIANEDVSSMNLADRVNLYFKIGNFLDISFTEEEKEIVSLIEKTETFEEVLDAAQKLYEYCKQEQQEIKISSIDNHDNSGGATSELEQQSESSESSESSEPQENQNSSSTDGSMNTDAPQSGQNNDSKRSNYSSSPSNSTSQNKDPEVKTVSKLEEKIRQLASSTLSSPVYVEVPKLDLKSLIVENKEIHTYIETSFVQQQDAYNSSHKSLDIFKESDSDFLTFKKSTQKEVNYLVKEFECRKAADTYSRSQVSKTGILDCSNLHTYQFNDDIFKKITTIPEGKNHGLVFILDWSGSMTNVLLDTLKQLYNLMWFCKKVSIPFDVYAFTNDWRTVHYDYQKCQYVCADRKSSYEKKEGLLAVHESFSLMHIFTHRVSSNTLEQQMKNIWRLAKYFPNPYAYKYHCPAKLNLSGTPLNESLMSLHQIIPEFQEKNRLQKVHCIILTDGEADPPPYHVKIKRSETNSYIGSQRIPYDRVFLRDRQLGTTYKGSFHQFSDTLLKNLRDKFPQTSFIGIRLLSGSDVSRFLNLYHQSNDAEYHKIQNQWKKENSFILKSSGYNSYFGISASSLSQDSEFEIEENATKTQIKSAFVKSLKTKKLNKKILGEFISLIV